MGNREAIEAKKIEHPRKEEEQEEKKKGKNVRRPKKLIFLHQSFNVKS